LRLSPDAESYYSRGWAHYQKGAYLSTLGDFVQASWRNPRILGRWIWTPLVPAVWLIQILLRRRKAKQGEHKGDPQPGQAPVSG
jgi:hypothetical protein